MKFRAVRDSYGFLGRYWTEGDEGECPEGTILNRNFVSLEPKQESDAPAPPVAAPVVQPPVVAPAPKRGRGKKQPKPPEGSGAA